MPQDLGWTKKDWDEWRKTGGMGYVPPQLTDEEKKGIEDLKQLRKTKNNEAKKLFNTMVKDWNDASAAQKKFYELIKPKMFNPMKIKMTNTFSLFKKIWDVEKKGRGRYDTLTEKAQGIKDKEGNKDIKEAYNALETAKTKATKSKTDFLEHFKDVVYYPVDVGSQDSEDEYERGRRGKPIEFPIYQNVKSIIEIENHNHRQWKSGKYWNFFHSLDGYTYSWVGPPHHKKNFDITLLYLHDTPGLRGIINHPGLKDCGGGYSDNPPCYYSDLGETKYNGIGKGIGELSPQITRKGYDFWDVMKIGGVDHGPHKPKGKNKKLNFNETDLNDWFDYYILNDWKRFHDFTYIFGELWSSNSKMPDPEYNNSRLTYTWKRRDYERYLKRKKKSNAGSEADASDVKIDIKGGRTRKRRRKSRKSKRKKRRTKKRRKKRRTKKKRRRRRR